jgi:hypothetical protein
MARESSLKLPAPSVLLLLNAALAALMAARPKEWRGGNSQHTRNLRCMHDAPQDVLIECLP